MRSLHLYAGLYPGKGIGHLVRTHALKRYLEGNSDWRVSLGTNDPAKAWQVLERMGHEEAVQERPPMDLDILLIDSPENEAHLVKASGHGKQVVRLDYFDYMDSTVDVIVNLHNKEGKGRPSEFHGSIHEGLEYAIIRDEILTARSSVHDPGARLRVLVLFGGEDPHRNTRQVLDWISGSQSSEMLDLTVIRPPLLPAEELESYVEIAQILEPSWEVGLFYAASDIVICGGGTVLLEAFCFARPVIAIPQHAGEEEFIRYVSTRIPLFELTALEDMVAHYSEYKARVAPRCASVMDGAGKQRIWEILEALPCG